MIEHIQYIIDKYSSQLRARLKEEVKDITVDQVIDALLACDPSNGKKLTDWLVKTYIAKGFRWEDVEIGAESKLAEVLGLYKTHFSQIPKKQRNIYIYQSYGELYRLIEPYIPRRIVDENTPGSREIRRRERAQALLESEVLYRSEDMIVAVPLTRNAAQWWGKGTKWCTAALKNNMFDDYNQYAPLIVITLLNPGSALKNQTSDLSRNENSDSQINQGLSLRNAHSSLLNSGSTRGAEKFQLWTDGDDIQFMDAMDCELDMRWVDKNWDRIKSIMDQMIEWNGESIQFIPENRLTTEMVERSVLQTKLALNCIPEDFLTEELCKLAVSKDGEALEMIPSKFITLEICMLALESDYLAMFHVPEQLKTLEFCMRAVSINGMLLFYVPQELRTAEVCIRAVEQNGLALRSVPSKFKTLDFCKQVVEKNGDALVYVPNQFRTAEIYRIAIEQEPFTLEYMPDEFKSAEICMQAIKQNGLVIKYVPIKHQTRELLRLAVEQNPKAIKNIDFNLVSAALCRIAIEKDGLLLGNIPKNFLTPELCWIAIGQNPKALEYVPTHFKTAEDCRSCVELDGLMICFTPSEFITEELCRIAVGQNSSAFFLIPNPFKTIELEFSSRIEIENYDQPNIEWNLESLEDLRTKLNQTLSCKALDQELVQPNP